jgi:hypothetical protein
MPSGKRRQQSEPRARDAARGRRKTRASNSRHRFCGDTGAGVASLPRAFGGTLTPQYQRLGVLVNSARRLFRFLQVSDSIFDLLVAHSGNVDILLHRDRAEPGVTIRAASRAIETASGRSPSSKAARIVCSITSSGVIPSAAALFAISRVFLVAAPSVLPAPARLPPWVRSETSRAFFPAALVFVRRLRACRHERT